MAIAKSSLRILMVERFGEAFNQSSVRLRYTPRAFALDPANRAVYVAEADHATVPLAERPDLAGGMDDGAQVGCYTRFRTTSGCSQTEVRWLAPWPGDPSGLPAMPLGSPACPSF